MSMYKNARLLRTTGAGTHEDLRRILRGLRPTSLDQQGLVAAMERLDEEVTSAGIILIELDTASMTGLRLDAELESAAYGILQEAIFNSIRHSSAKPIRVVMQTRKNELQPFVTDDGKGFDASGTFQNTEGSHGLLSIREGTMICRGRSEMQSSPGPGTTVPAHLPLVMRSEWND